MRSLLLFILWTLIRVVVNLYHHHHRLSKVLRLHIRFGQIWLRGVSNLMAFDIISFLLFNFFRAIILHLTCTWVVAFDEWSERMSVVHVDCIVPTLSFPILFNDVIRDLNESQAYSPNGFKWGASGMPWHWIEWPETKITSTSIDWAK